MANQYVNKVVLADGTTLMDLSADTVAADKLLPGYTAHGADGSLITGTLSGVTILAPSSGTNSFYVTVPSGEGTVTFTFTVDSGGNVTID